MRFIFTEESMTLYFSLIKDYKNIFLKIKLVKSFDEFGFAPLVVNVLSQKYLEY